MIPEFPDFKPLCLEDRDALVEAHQVAAPAICDTSPANLYIWRDCQRVMLTRIQDNLCVLLHPHTERPYFLEPYGRHNLCETARTCLEHAVLISRAQARFTASLPGEDFEISRQRDTFDYMYLVQHLAELKGKGFDGKRNHIRKFARNYPGYEFRTLDREQLHRAAALFEVWTAARGNGGSSEFTAAVLNHDCQRRALGRAFEEYSRLGLIGGALLVRGEMQGFIVGSRGAGDSAIAHFSYANTELPGVYQTLLWEACRRLFPAFTYLNMEEDLGVPGLRKTKLSWQPWRLEEKSSIRLRRESRSDEEATWKTASCPPQALE